MEKFLSKVLDEQFQVTLDPPEEPPRYTPPPTTKELDDRLHAMQAKVLPGDATGVNAEASGQTLEESPAKTDSKSSSHGSSTTQKGKKKSAQLTAAQNAELETRLEQLELMHQALIQREEQLQKEKEELSKRQQELDQAEAELHRREKELLAEHQEMTHKHQLEALRLEQEREELLAASKERQAEVNQVTRYNDELIDLGALLRKEQEEVNTLTSLLQNREHQLETVTNQNRQLMKVIKQRESEIATLKETNEQLQAMCAKLTADLEQKDADLGKLQQEKEKAAESSGQLQTEISELQEVIESRTSEVADFKRKYEDACLRLDHLQERLKELSNRPVERPVDRPAPVRHAVVDVVASRLEKSAASEAPLALGKWLKFRDTKAGLIIAGVLCLLMIFLAGGSAGDDVETLRQRNQQLGQMTVQQRTELSQCHSSVNILTQRLAQCGANGGEAKPDVPTPKTPTN